MTAVCADKYLFHRLEGTVVWLNSFQSKLTTASPATRRRRWLHQHAHLIPLLLVTAQSEWPRRRESGRRPGPVQIPNQAVSILVRAGRSGASALRSRTAWGRQVQQLA